MVITNFPPADKAIVERDKPINIWNKEPIPEGAVGTPNPEKLMVFIEVNPKPLNVGWGPFPPITTQATITNNVKKNKPFMASSKK